MVRQTGGIRWKQGSDGCIFLPAVECEGKPDLYSSNPMYLSKMMPKGTPDERTETFIANHFPSVVNGKGVLISVERCIPRFSDSRNKNGSPNVQRKFIDPRHYRTQTNAFDAMPPCQKIDMTTPERYTNFVMEKYANETYYEVCQRNDYINDNFKKIKLLRKALNAAVALVPDNGPWVLGYDFHVNNIFVKMDAEPFTSLADWGRTIIIENPKDAASIAKGIVDELDHLRGEGWTSTRWIQNMYGTQTKKKYPLIGFDDYPSVPQFEYIMKHSVNNCMITAEQKGTVHPDIDNVRLVTIYGMLLSASRSTTIYFDSSLIKDLEKTSTQKEIIDVLNSKFQVPGISKFIDLDTLFPPPPPLLSPSAPLTSPQNSQSTLTLTPALTLTPTTPAVSQPQEMYRNPYYNPGAPGYNGMEFLLPNQYNSLLRSMSGMPGGKRKQTRKHKKTLKKKGKKYTRR